MAQDILLHLVAPNGLKYAQPLGLFINNEWVQSKQGSRITTVNPANENEICSVYSAGKDDVDDAVCAARKALHGPWSKLDAAKRGEALYRLATLLERDAHIIATIESWDNGKTYHSAKEEDVPECVSVLKYYAGFADKFQGNAFTPSNDKLSYTIREPIGVIGTIIPWNYPLMMFTYKLAPALAAGNTMIIKVAEQTPLSALYICNLIKEADFPPGVVNVINGYGAEAGGALVEHSSVDMISFTGSTPTGRGIMKAAAGTMKRVTLETGGKSPMLVFSDADLDEAAKWGFLGIMSNAGQNCSATSRILVHDSIYDEYIARFCNELGKYKVGDPFNDATFQGPQITRAQYTKILDYVETGKKDGAKLIAGGQAYKNVSGRGLFIQPTVFIDAVPGMKIYEEEVFGPFVVIGRFSTEAEAVEMANASMFGLGASIFTKDIAKAHDIARKVEAGTVWINSSQDMDYRVPFGGYKQSGIGLELGEAGILGYTKMKSVHVNLRSQL